MREPVVRERGTMLLLAPAPQKKVGRNRPMRTRYSPPQRENIFLKKDHRICVLTMRVGVSCGGHDGMKGFALIFGRFYMKREEKTF